MDSSASFNVAGGAFRSKQSEGKAVKRLHRALPTSPRKYRQAVRKLAIQLDMQLTDKVDNDERRGRKAVGDDTVDQVNAFFLRDDISRHAPGMKDCRRVNEEMVQKRHLYNNISETYELYKAEHGDSNHIGRTKFADPRPPPVCPLNDMPHNVCVCAIHEHIFMCVSVLAK